LFAGGKISDYRHLLFKKQVILCDGSVPLRLCVANIQHRDTENAKLHREKLLQVDYFTTLGDIFFQNLPSP